MRFAYAVHVLERVIGVISIAAAVIVGFVIPHAACIGKQAQTDGTRVFNARHREEQLCRNIGFFVTTVADFLAVFVINFRAQRTAFKAADRA